MNRSLFTTKFHKTLYKCNRGHTNFYKHTLILKDLAFIGGGGGGRHGNLRSMPGQTQIYVAELLQNLYAGMKNTKKSCNQASKRNSSLDLPGGLWV